MKKLFSSQLKWLASLIILAVATLPIGSCMPTNLTPVISSLIASEEPLYLLDSCQLECIAYDLDGDELSYIWSADSGNISGEGSVVTWVAPDAPGAYTITVEVTDGRGGEGTTQLTISVVAVNHPPVIESLTPKRWTVVEAETSTIECIASDPDGDELSYIWSAESGNISGEGSVVTWIAPDAPGAYTITVEVTDGRGGEASESISIEVCPPCSGAAS